MDTLRGRIAPDNTDIRLGGFAVMDELVNARRILIIGWNILAC